MKKLALLTILFSTPVFAEETVCKMENVGTQELETKVIDTSTPKHLRGATIIVRTADGRESSVPAEKFKVVPRKQQFIVTHDISHSQTQCTTTQVKTNTVYIKPGSNRVSILAGKGLRSGLDKNTKGDTVEVKSRQGAVGGLMYQRIIDQSLTPFDLSVGGQVQTNKTILFNLGLDF
jgi:hypothetical protein